MTDSSTGENLGVLELLRLLVPPGVACGSRNVAHRQPALPPEEAALTSRMHPVRLREFAAGRAAARDALAALGLPGLPILAGPGRRPIWPDGLVGSITHTAAVAAAVAAEARNLRAVGLDAEEGTGLEAPLLPVVCRPEELACLAGSGTAAAMGKLIFSAKEAAYKCLSPVTGLFLEFHDLEVMLHPDKQGFSVLGHGPRAGDLPLAALRGRFGKADGLVVAVCWLPAEASATPGSEHRPVGNG